MMAAMAWPALVSLCASFLLTVTLQRLARRVATRLYRSAVLVYGGVDQLPIQRGAIAWFVLWFSPVAAWLIYRLIIGDAPAAGWLLLTVLLGLLALIDARTGLLPNELTLPLLLSGLGWQSWLAGSLLPPAHCCWGVVFGWLFPSFLNAGLQRWRGVSAIGQGDSRLLAGMGGWLGVQWLPALWLMASLAMLFSLTIQWLLTRRWQSSVAMGPFLAAAGAVAMISHMLEAGLQWHAFNP